MVANSPDPRFAKRLAEVLAITAILMISLGVSGKLLFDTLGWEETPAATTMVVFNLALAAVLLRWYAIRRAAEPPVFAPPAAAPPRFTAGQDAYRNNPSARLSCRHLQAVEGLIRSRGIDTFPIYASSLRADCIIDEPALRGLITLDPCVQYSEYRDDRDRDASLVCTECKYSISLRHPSMGGTVFPAL